ncbi:MAG: nucleotidyltransferase domain-containing protein [Armatimonadetes bacterium]|nr:nucleotidyltransferase domain-containing protein [Armatimonadota bacterium]
MKSIDQIPNLADTDRRVLNDLKAIVRRFAPDAELFLYGSAARGCRAPESDLDVLVLLNAPLSKVQENMISEDVYELELSSRTVISTVFHTRNEWLSPRMKVTPYFKEVRKTAAAI